MNVTLTRHLQALIERLLASGRYRDPNEVIRAGLRKLEEDEARRLAGLERFPPGSLRRSFTAKRNEEELCLLKGASLAVEAKP